MVGSTPIPSPCISQHGAYPLLFSIKIFLCLMAGNNGYGFCAPVYRCWYIHFCAARKGYHCHVAIAVFNGGVLYRLTTLVLAWSRSSCPDIYWGFTICWFVGFS